LLHQAAEAIRAGADQSKRVEARVRGWLALATQEIERAQARIEDLEARLQVSEARANAAEAHVKQTEEWLQRAHDTIATELSAGMRLLERSEVTSAKRSESKEPELGPVLASPDVDRADQVTTGTERVS